MNYPRDLTANPLNLCTAPGCAPSVNLHGCVMRLSCYPTYQICKCSHMRCIRKHEHSVPECHSYAKLAQDPAEAQPHDQTYPSYM